MARSRALSAHVANRLHHAAAALGTCDPVPLMHGIIERTFTLPPGDPRYAHNALTPGGPPFESSFSALHADQLRVNIQPLGPEASAADRRNEATREMRRLVGGCFGDEPLRWFDERSETWRGLAGGNNLNFGAFFGSSYDRDGLFTSKVYYETGPDQMGSLPSGLFGVVSTALTVMPGLVPLFTTIAAQRDAGAQRMTFAHPAPLRIADLQPLLDAFGLGPRMSGILQVLGVTLGGRFDLPRGATLIGLGQTPNGPEIEIYVVLDRIPDLPVNFLSLLTLSLSERPRELSALQRWMSAFTPEDEVWPGHFSILSVRTGRTVPPRVSLYLRPAEFELPGEAVPASAQRFTAA